MTACRKCFRFATDIPTHSQTHGCTQTSTHTKNARTDTHAPTQKYTHTHLQTHRRTRAHTQLQAHTPTQKHAHRHTCTHTKAPTKKYTHTRTQSKYAHKTNTRFRHRRRRHVNNKPQTTKVVRETTSHTDRNTAPRSFDPEWHKRIQPSRRCTLCRRQTHKDDESLIYTTHIRTLCTTVKLTWCRDIGYDEQAESEHHDVPYLSIYVAIAGHLVEAKKTHYF